MQQLVSQSWLAQDRRAAPKSPAMKTAKTSETIHILLLIAVLPRRKARLPPSRPDVESARLRARMPRPDPRAQGREPSGARARLPGAVRLGDEAGQDWRVDAPCPGLCSPHPPTGLRVSGTAPRG